MKQFVFYTTEGYTMTPNGGEIENCQILAFECAATIGNARDLFFRRHHEQLSRQGFTLENVICREII